jgi:hypothetical protein
VIVKVVVGMILSPHYRALSFKRTLTAAPAARKGTSGGRATPVTVAAVILLAPEPMVCPSSAIFTQRVRISP